MNITSKVLKSNQIISTVIFDGEIFSAMGDTQEQTIVKLKTLVANHFNAKNYVAQLAIDAAAGKIK